MLNLAQLDCTLRASFTVPIESIRGMEDPNDQFMALASECPYGFQKLAPTGKPTIQHVYDLIDFAADETASDSLLVRTKALDVAISMLLDLSAYNDGNQEIQAEAAILNEVIPKISKHTITSAQNPFMGATPSDGASLSYRRAVTELAEIEGLKKELIYPNWHEFSGDPLGMQDCNPVVAFLALKYIADIANRPHDLPVSKLTGLVLLAYDIQQKLGYDPNGSEPVPAEKLRRDAQVSYELSRLPEAAPYVAKLKALKKEALKLSDVFPGRYANKVNDSAIDLIAKCSYAISEHLKNDKTSSVMLPLRGDESRGLPLHIKRDEPLDLLETLQTAIQEIHDQLTNCEVRVSSVADEPDFQLYRFWRPDGTNNLSVYIRPYGARGYDSTFEYGNNSGVEASISYVIQPDLSPRQLLALGRPKGKHPDNRISIRLDREGVAPEQRSKAGIKRDPTINKGTLSLDIGSVLGDEKDIGTRIGRFLAWGDMLRSKALGEDIHLNHVVRHFEANDGHAEIFASEALSLRNYIADRAIGQALLAKLLAV